MRKVIYVCGIAALALLITWAVWTIGGWGLQEPKPPVTIEMPVPVPPVVIEPAPVPEPNPAPEPGPPQVDPVVPPQVYPAPLPHHRPHQKPHNHHVAPTPKHQQPRLLVPAPDDDFWKLPVHPGLKKPCRYFYFGCEG